MILSSRPLVAPDRSRPEAEPAVVEDLHRDPEALAGLAEDVLRRHPDIVEAQPPEVVRPQAQGVVALADLEPLHPLLEDQGDMAVLAADLGPRKGDEDVALAAVPDVALLPVQHPGAVRLGDRARAQLVGVRPRLGLGQREPGQPPPACQVGQKALLLLVAAEEDDSLHPDRLVHTHHHRERSVDLGKGLEHPAVAGLGEPLAPVLLGDVEAAEAGLTELGEVRSPIQRLRSHSWTSQEAASSRSEELRPRILSCSAASGAGKGKIISSRI